MIKIEQLKTEYQVNPLGIVNLKPRFTWILGKETDEKQLSYNVKVTNRGKLVWDSGVVNSDNTVNIEYNGEALKSCEIYEVEVKVKGQVATSSAYGTFETALLYDSDWKGVWSGTNANFTGESLLSRKAFNVIEKEIARARVYLIGLGYHEIYINGDKVGESFLNPACSDTGKTVYYKTYDITKMLKPGLNAIAMEFGNGWVGKKSYLLQMFIEYADGTKYEDRSCVDGMWWMGRGATTRNSIYDGETHDEIALKEIGDWKAPDFQPKWNKGWMYTFHQLSEKGVKMPDLTDEIKITKEYQPVTVTKVGKDMVYDFGQNMSGWVKLTVKGKKGTKVSMRFGEQLTEDGNVNQLNLRTARQLDEIILSGDGEEVFQPKFTYHGFRYMQLAIEGNAEVIEAIAQHVHNACTPTGYFECSDERLNLLHKNAVITEENNLHSMMTDCPQRDERIGWLNDVSSRIFQNINNFDLSRMLPKILLDIEDTQRPDGAIADCAPFFAGEPIADPVCVCYLLMGYKAYQYYGDKKILEDRYDGFKKWVDYLLTRCSSKYVMNYSYYGDWVVPECYQDTKVGGEYISSAYLNWHLKVLSYIAKVLGKKKDAKLYAKMNKESTLVINKKWFDAENMSYENGSQTANAMALSIGYAPDYARPALAKSIIDDAKKRGNHNTSGNQGYRHFFYEIGEAGETDLFIKILTNPEYPGWGCMLEGDATTIWERWEKTMQLEMHSFNHPMFASFDGVFYHYIAGIKIDDDACGCDKITIAPKTANELTFVKCHLDTVRGRIASSWERIDGKVKLTLEIPHGTTAKLDFAGTLNGISFEKGKLLEGGEYVIEMA